MRKPRDSAQQPAFTIRDVAARAAVSVATVSRVLNRTGPVRASTYERVLKIAQEMNYVPHAGARSLSMRSTKTVGVLLPDLHGEFFSEVIRGIDLSARQTGYHLLVSGSHSDRQEMRAMLQAVRGRVDGLIVMSPDLDASSLVAHFPVGLPVIMLNSEVSGSPSITIDNAGGARSMVRHLIGLGHTRIAFICGPGQNADAVERNRGYRAALQAAGIATDPELEFPGHFTEESGYDAAKKIVEHKPRPTAIFAANDAMAIGALRALREASIRVPTDMALVGFDDIPISRYITPTLTTVSVATGELGRRAFDMLLAALSGEDQTIGQRREQLPTVLVIRESCGSSVTQRTESVTTSGGGNA